MEAEENPRKLAVLIVDDSWTMLSTLSSVVAGTADMVVAGRASTGYQGLELAMELRPDVVLVDAGLPDVDGFQMVSALTVRLPTSTVVILSPDTSGPMVQRAMLSGAHAYLPKPVSPELLVQTVRSARSRQQERLSRLAGTRKGAEESRAPERQTRRGRFVAVAGAKGGVGKTTVASSLALAMKARTARQVAAVDGDFAFGDLGLHLNLSPGLNVLDLLSRANELDSTIVDKVLALHSSGLRLLLGPNLPEEADLIKVDELSQLYDALPRYFDYIVVDCQQYYDDRLLTTLDHADLIVLVLTPEVGPIRNSVHFLRLSRSLGYPADRIMALLNRADSGVGIGLPQVQSMLGLKEVLTLPSGGRTVVLSVNRGDPLVISDPTSSWAKAIHSLTEQIEMRLAAARK